MSRLIFKFSVICTVFSVLLYSVLPKTFSASLSCSQKHWIWLNMGKRWNEIFFLVQRFHRSHIFMIIGCISFSLQPYRMHYQGSVREVPPSLALLLRYLFPEVSFLPWSFQSQEGGSTAYPSHLPSSFFRCSSGEIKLKLENNFSSWVLGLSSSSFLSCLIVWCRINFWL